MGFRVYHLKHHSHQGNYEWDADWRTIGRRGWSETNGSAKRLVDAFSFFQLTRPPRLKAITMWDRWFLINLHCAAAYDVAMVYFCGWAGLLYLVFLSSFPSASIPWEPVDPGTLHQRPGPGDIQLLRTHQLLALNMGYHNEHHDLPSIPWNNLPKLRALAPEFYDNLKYHSSWSRLLFQFIFDPRYTLFRESSGLNVKGSPFRHDPEHGRGGTVALPAE